MEEPFGKLRDKVRNDPQRAARIDCLIKQYDAFLCLLHKWDMLDQKEDELMIWARITPDEYQAIHQARMKKGDDDEKGRSLPSSLASEIPKEGPA
jgi:hypothetical protein